MDCFPTVITHMCTCMCKLQTWHCFPVTSIWVLRKSPWLSRASVFWVRQCASLNPLHNLPHTLWCASDAANFLSVVCAFPLYRCVKKNKLFLNMQVNGNGCEDSPSRYTVMSARTPGVTPAATTAPYTLPGTPTLMEEHSAIKSELWIFIHFYSADLVKIHGWPVSSSLV